MALARAGTPVLSRPIEIFTCAAALRPAIFGAQKEYGLRYCAAHQGKWGWDEKGSSNLMHLSAVLAHTMMVRREKRSVLSQLPEKTRQLVPIELAAKDLGAIRRRIAEMQKQGSEPGGESHDPMLGETYMMTGDAKVIGLDGFGWLLMASGMASYGFGWLRTVADCS